jgi:hypothetical protein
VLFFSLSPEYPNIIRFPRLKNSHPLPVSNYFKKLDRLLSFSLTSIPLYLGFFPFL